MAKTTTTDKSTKAASEKAVEGAVKGKKVSPPKAGNAPNALQKPLQPSEDLAVIVGSQPLARGEVVSKVWEYIKTNNLQNPCKQAGDRGRRGAQEDLRQGQGNHV